MKPVTIAIAILIHLFSFNALAFQDSNLPGLHPDGPVGIWRTYSAQRRAPGPIAFGLSITSTYFNLDDFPTTGTDLERLTGKAALSYTPVDTWEIFLAGSALTSNRDSAADLVQQVGNMDFGTKLALDLNERWSLGVLGAGRYRRGAVDLGLTDTSLSWDALAVATLDLQASGIPLRLHANAGFRWDQTDHVLPFTAPEASRILLGVNGKNSVLGALGVEMPLRPVVLSLEYTMEYAADAAGVGVFDSPQRATLGLRYFPSEDRTWAIGLASDFGFFASDGASRIVKEPDFAFQGGLIYHFAKPGSRVEVLPLERDFGSSNTYVFGRVTNARTGHPVGGAVIRLCGRDISDIISNVEDGQYRSYPLPPGDCNISVLAEGYGPVSQVVRIPDTGNLQQDFILNPSEPDRGIVVVRVKDSRGEPTQGQITLPDVPKARAMDTDAEGRLRIKLPVGTYMIRADGKGGAFATATVDVVEGTEVYAEFVLKPGSAQAYLDGQWITLVEPIRFKSGSEVITEASKKTLKEVANILRANPQIVLVEVGGHSDSSGRAELNQSLSTMRAESVAKYLISLGIQKTRLNAVGYGQDQPIADNGTPEGREANRRVEFKILK